MLEALGSKKLRPPNISLLLFFTPFPTCGGRAGDGGKSITLVKSWGWGEINNAGKKLGMGGNQ